MGIFSPRARRGIVLCGAYGMDNAGDDAVLAAILQDMRWLERDIPITVLARHPRSVARRYSVSAVHPLNMTGWLLAMRRASLFISGGGSLLQDVTSRRSLWYYLATIALAKKAGCAVQLYGCGIGPLCRDSSRTYTRRILNACADAITLRDAESGEVLKDLGITEPRVMLGADPAFRLEPSGGERERKLGLVLRDWPDFWCRVPAFAAAARYAYERYKLPPVLLCLAPEDRAAAGSVAKALEAEGVPCSISLHPRRVGRMTLVLSMRLHGLIFALRDGAPAAGVSYDPKVSAFCRETGLPCVRLEAADSEALCRLIDEAILLDTETLSATAETLRQREKVNARTAAEFL